MTIEFNCKFCGKILRTGDDKAGRQAKCPSCGETIAVPAETGAEEHFETFDDPPAAVPPSAAAPRAASSARHSSKAQDFVDDVDPYDDEDYDDDHDDDPYDDDDDPAPRRRASQRMKNCPVCGAQVKAKALKCRHCGEELDDDLPPRPSGRNRGRSGARRSGPQEVYAGEIISDAWQIYTENMGIVIGCHVITSIMIVVLYVVAYLGMALV
ncbi:MAG: hypothetical protein O3A00_10200, partial [Planctomycetota bacterium]|nr:hypothetical protein [Planctomycetota bacterium]